MLISGGDNQIRTGESRFCRPLPYHLAMSPYIFYAPKNMGRKIWSGLRGLNSLPRPWQGRALPDELNPQMVPSVGIEPTTRGFSVPCSTNWATKAYRRFVRRRLILYYVFSKMSTTKIEFFISFCKKKFSVDNTVLGNGLYGLFSNSVNG